MSGRGHHIGESGYENKTPPSGKVQVLNLATGHSNNKSSIIRAEVNCKFRLRESNTPLCVGSITLHNRC